MAYPCTRVAGVVPDRRATRARRASGLHGSVMWWTLPSGSATPETPTVETWMAVLPVSADRKRVMSNCWRDSAEWPKEALLVGTAMNCAPFRTASLTMPSYPISKQIGTATRRRRPPAFTSRRAGPEPARMSR